MLTVTTHFHARPIEVPVTFQNSKCTLGRPTVTDPPQLGDGSLGSTQSNSRTWTNMLDFRGHILEDAAQRQVLGDLAQGQVLGDAA